MFKTLDDLKDKNKPASKKPGHFTGNEYSGQEIQHPDSVDDIIKQAEENSKKSNPSQQKPNKGEQNCKITLYQNGFKVDDGEFRPYNDESNKKFMEELKEGNVPSELRGKYPQGLSVGLEDRRDEQFRLPSPPKYIAFSGQGVNLGQQQQQVQTKSQQKVEVNLNAGKLIVNQNQPKTKIQVRLHTGQAVEIEINNKDSVQSLYNHIQSIAPAINGFQIVAGFPPKPIQNLKQSIEDADLLESRVTQKLI